MLFRAKQWTIVWSIIFFFLDFSNVNMADAHVTATGNQRCRHESDEISLLVILLLSTLILLHEISKVKSDLARHSCRSLIWIRMYESAYNQVFPCYSRTTGECSIGWFLHSDPDLTLGEN